MVQAPLKTLLKHLLNLLKALALVVALAVVLVACSRQEPLGYASLGDSIAAGVGSSAPSSTSYSALYRESLEERTGRRIEYRQLALSGETAGSFIGEYPAGDSQLVRAERFLERHPGARVTLSLGGNDLLRVRDESASRRREAVSEYGENLDFILEILDESSEPPPRVTVLTLYAPEPGGRTNRWIGAMNEEIRGAAREHGASVAEAGSAFRGHTREYLRRYESGERDIHPNDRGYAALAQALLRAESGPPEVTGAS